MDSERRRSLTIGESVKHTHRSLITRYFSHPHEERSKPDTTILAYAVLSLVPTVQEYTYLKLK
jgi:hypothetical protein